MKRTIFAVAALGLMLSGCVKNEVSEVKRASSNVITFDLSTTRAGVTIANDLQSGFTVYGTSGLAPTDWYTDIDGTNNHVYAGGKWGWANVDATWPTNASDYPMTFYAWYPTVAAKSDTSPFVTPGDPELTFEFTVAADAAGQVDLVAGTAEATDGKPALGSLTMTFNHILSKVNFGIKADNDFKAVVQAIGVVNVANKGTYDAINGIWGDNTTYGTSYNYFNEFVPQGSGPAYTMAEFAGDGTAKAFYAGSAADGAHLMLMPQDPSLPTDNNWEPVLGTAPSTETYVRMLYRLEAPGGDDYIGYADATDHPDGNNTTYNPGGYDGELFVLVGYPYASEWVKGKGYTYNISLPGESGGYLLDTYYYDDKGNQTLLEVKDIQLSQSVLSATSVIRLTPAVGGWDDGNVAVDPVISVSLRKNLALTVGGTYGEETITATVLPSDVSGGVTWSVTPSSGVVNITDNLDGTLTVTGVANGTAVITATKGTKTATCNVTVGNWSDLTSGVLNNTEADFTHSGPMTSHSCYAATDWTANSVALTTGSVIDSSNYGPECLWIRTFASGGGGHIPLNNWKLYQTVELEAGRYHFAVDICIGTAPKAYAVAALDSDLPDTDDVEQDALAFALVPSNISVFQYVAGTTVIDCYFDLPEKSVVSLGFVATVSNANIGFRSVKLSAIQ